MAAVWWQASGTFPEKDTCIPAKISLVTYGFRKMLTTLGSFANLVPEGETVLTKPMLEAKLAERFPHELEVGLKLAYLP